MDEMSLLPVIADKTRSAGLEPALAFLSGLGSFPMGVYYARVIGEAALRARAGWDRTLAAFLIAAPVAWLLVGLADVGEERASGHAAFIACLVGVLWRHTEDRQSRTILLAFAVAVGVARVVLGASAPIGIAIGCVLGLAAAWAARRLVESLTWISAPAAAGSMLFRFSGKT